LTSSVPDGYFILKRTAKEARRFFKEEGRRGRKWKLKHRQC
jgi:hypothetical protein